VAPTEITIAMTTDVPCAQVTETSIAVGDLVGLEARPPAASSTICDAATGTIGTLVIVPSGAKDELVALRVVLGIGRTADQCVADGYKGCIVARRAMHFLPHVPLKLPIALRTSCLGVVCAPTETCVQGDCASATIEDATRCASSSSADACGDGLLLGQADGGTPPPDGRGDAMPEGAADVTVPTDASGDTGASDAPDGTTPADAAGRDATSDGADAVADRSPPDAPSDAPPTLDAGPSCTSSASCLAGEACNQIDVAEHVTRCGPLHPGGAALGTACTTNAQCESNYCLLPDGICSVVCAQTSDCTVGACTQVSEATNRTFVYACHPKCSRNKDCTAAGTLCTRLYERNGVTYHPVCDGPYGHFTFASTVNGDSDCDTNYSFIWSPFGPTCTWFCGNGGADCAAPLMKCQAVGPDNVCQP
jgi:hypothetical protein